MERTNPTRRSALGILATGPIAMLPAVAVMSCNERALATELSVELADKIAAYRRIDEQFDRYMRDVTAPASEAYEAAVAAIPHHRTVNSFVNIEGTATHLSTESDASVATARRALGGVIYIESNPDADYWATVRELVDAADRRKAEAQRIHHELNIDTVREQEDALGDQHYAALDAVMKTPARSMADLMTKLEFVEETDRWEAVSDDILADVRRLSGRA